ncbi:hypothetical protein AWC38_SpisGene16160 [Stylophora pistillata]|uniref:Uncharacterized protein n=2 Tax=Stylophora pistillata TaxID=50429 RepID=A0A2B4RP99_STYPI|nr:hypothetical protein AWC38_SpisGene16160 [Stylophora pistillata]
MTALRHTCYLDTRNNRRKEEQWSLGVCRIRRKETSQRRAVTRGCGFLVKNLIIPDPARSCNLSYPYCLITTIQVIDVGDSLEYYYLEFQKLHKKLKTVPLQGIADVEYVHRTCNVVFMRITPSGKYPANKESLFTYRPFGVTNGNVNERNSNDLLCVFVEDKDKSFDVIDLRIQRKVEQNSDRIYFQISEDNENFTTYNELTRNINRKPYGGVILRRQENQVDKYIADGCLDFTNDSSRSLSPVFFPPPYTDTSQDGPQILNGTSSGDGAFEAVHLSHEAPFSNTIVTTAPASPPTPGTSTATVTTTTTTSVTVAPALALDSAVDITVTVTPAPVPAAAPCSTPTTVPTTAIVAAVPALSSVSANAIVTTAPSSTPVSVTAGSMPNTVPSTMMGTAAPALASVSAAAITATVTAAPTPTPVSAVATSSTTVTAPTTLTVTAASDLAAVMTVTAVGTTAITGASASTTITTDTVATTSAGIPAILVTATGPRVAVAPQIMEEENTDIGDLTQVRTPTQVEAGNGHENFLVSEILVLPQYKVLYDKLVRSLDNRANLCIANWEHLACAMEAPKLVRLKCKLSTNYSHTEMLLEVLAVRENKEVVTVKDLIAALKSIGRNDIVRMITKVHCDAKSSTESLRDFKDSSSNHDLLEGIITQLDDKTLSGIKIHWKHLGSQFQISLEKLEVIEFCAPYNPTKSLMEYLLVNEEDLTMRTFFEKVRQKFKRLDVV